MLDIDNFEYTTWIALIAFIFIGANAFFQFLIRNRRRSKNRLNTLSDKFEEIQFSLDSKPSEEFSGYLRSISQDAVSLIVGDCRVHKGTCLTFWHRPTRFRRKVEKVAARVVRVDSFWHERHHTLVQLKVEAQASSSSLINNRRETT